MIDSGDSRQGHPRGPSARDDVHDVHAGPLAKVHGLVIQPDASAVGRASITPYFPSDRNSLGCSKFGNDVSVSHGVFRRPLAIAREVRSDGGLSPNFSAAIVINLAIAREVRSDGGCPTGQRCPSSPSCWRSLGKYGAMAGRPIYRRSPPMCSWRSLGKYGAMAGPQARRRPARRMVAIAREVRSDGGGQRARHWRSLGKYRAMAGRPPVRSAGGSPSGDRSGSTERWRGRGD